MTTFNGLAPSRCSGRPRARRRVGPDLTPDATVSRPRSDRTDRGQAAGQLRGRCAPRSRSAWVPKNLGPSLDSSAALARAQAGARTRWAVATWGAGIVPHTPSARFDESDRCRTVGAGDHPCELPQISGRAIHDAPIEPPRATVRKFTFSSRIDRRSFADNMLGGSPPGVNPGRRPDCPGRLRYNAESNDLPRVIGRRLES